MQEQSREPDRGSEAEREVKMRGTAPAQNVVLRGAIDGTLVV